MTAQNYDVFISYSSKDKEWVRGELLQRIEKAGLRAFIDFRDFTRGAVSIREMERGVIECRKTLLILTPDYIDSEWAEIEVRMGQTLSPANRDLRLIPLLKTRCDKPLSIGSLTHIDFSDGADHDLAWRQLLTALGAAPEPVQFEAPSRDHWFLAHPYAMPPNFTGRVAERNMLTDWLTRDNAHPLLVLRALGGFGKSALTWHWLLHDVDPAEYPRVVWWSFYERDASFESFVVSTVRYLDPSFASSVSPRDNLVCLLKALHSRGTFLILDGFERALRAFGGLKAAYQGDETVGTSGGECDCLSSLAESFLRNVISSLGIEGKVLLTTRLRPVPVETRGGILLQGCREEQLVQLQPADAVAFFHAQGVRGGRAEIEAACDPYGYHPLSLRLLAGLIVLDLQQPGDIAAAQSLDVSGDLVQRQHHVLDQAYASLSHKRQKLLSLIACFRGEVNYDALKVLAKTESHDVDTIASEHRIAGPIGGEGSIENDLRDLIARGLLHHNLSTNRFDLHPIVRRYAYDRLAAPDRDNAHGRLVDYFAAVVATPHKVTTLNDLAPVIELYHHAAKAGRYKEAFGLFHTRLYEIIYFQLGAYQLTIDLLHALFPDGEDRHPRLQDEEAQGWILNALANAYCLSGQPRRALAIYELAIEIEEKLGSAEGVAGSLGNLAYMAQFQIGALRAAEANLRRRNDLFQQMNEEFREAVGRHELARVLTFRGAWAQSVSELAASLRVLENLKQTQSQGVVWVYRAQLELLWPRCTVVGGDLKPRGADVKTAIASARRALQLADETTRVRYPVPRDYIRAHWLLGAAYRVAGQLNDSEGHLHEALDRCRRINMVEHEGDILIELARLHMATGALVEGQRSAEEALVITERCGYVLQGADAHLVLAQLAKDRGDAKFLRHHATEALRLATCDGPPDYTYRAAFDEATALLR
jgi:tetratricopeptide (TPR) repeat protein